MNLKKVHQKLVSSSLLIYLTVLITILFRLIVNPDLHDLAFWGTAIVQIAIALLLLRLDHAFNIIKTKTVLPAFFYLLFTAVNPHFYFELEGSLLTLAVLFCLFFLFRSYQEPKSQLYTLDIGIIIATGSLVWPPFLLLFPFFLYGFYKLQSLNWKTFFSFWIGVTIPFIFFISWNIYQEKPDAIFNLVANYQTIVHVNFPSFTPTEWVSMGFFAFLFFFAIHNLFMVGISEKVRTIAYLYVLFFFSVYLHLLLMIQSAWKEKWALLVFLPIAFLLSHYLALSKRSIAVWILFLIILFFPVMFFIHLIG